jgi:hypothetical protein
MAFRQSAPSFFSLPFSELEFLGAADLFGIGGRFNSEMAANDCRSRWPILSEYASGKCRTKRHVKQDWHDNCQDCYDKMRQF